MLPYESLGRNTSGSVSFKEPRNESLLKPRNLVVAFFKSQSEALRRMVEAGLKKFEKP